MASTHLTGTRTSAAAVVGPWRLARPVGSGTWTETYQARPLNGPRHNSCDYVVKVARADAPPDQTRSLLAREAEVASQINHPHVVSVFSADLTGDRPYVVMPFVGEISLEQVLEHPRPSQLSPSLWIARQASQALQAIHQAGWIHADVQPQNMVLSSAGHVTVVDLGLARSQTQSSADGSMAGRLPYMAPEMVSSSLTAEPCSDVYSLGVVLYEMVTGKLPFAAEDAAGWITAHLQHTPVDPRAYIPALDREVVKLIAAMLAKQSIRRPSVAELIDRLAALEITHLGR